jgi:hypothetical protein
MPVSPALAESLAQEVVNLYAEAERTLLERTARALSKGLDSPQWAEDKLAQIGEYRRQVERVIDHLSQAAQKGVKDALLEAYERGGLSAVAELTRAQQEGVAKYGAIEREPMPRNPWVIREADGRVLHRFDSLEKARGFVDKHPEYEMELTKPTEPLSGLQATEALKRETLENLEATSARILRSSLDAYRSVISDTAAQVLLGTQTRREACQVALNRFAGRGITGFVDKAGRGWNLESYTEMAVRTGTAKAAIQGHTDKLQENGLDLVIISNAPRECPLCRPHEGKVYSISGNDPKYPSLQSARSAGLFHANCRHSASLYQPGITKRPTGPAADPEGYAAAQKQRYLERQIRAAKRVEAAAMEDAAKRAAQDRVRAYQAKIRQHVEANDLKRLSYREQIGKAH